VFSELLKHPRAIGLSIGFHVVVIAIILINFHFSDSTKLVKQDELAKTVKAEIVDQQQLEAQKNRKKKEQEARRKRELEKQNKEKAAKAREAEKKRKQAEQKKHKIALEKKKKEEAKRIDEAKQKADKKKKEEAKRIAEAKKKADQKKKQQETVKQAEQQRKQQEAEKQKKLAEEKRLREEQLAREAEQKRIAAEKLKQEADKQRLAEEEQKRRQQELAEILKAEESQRRLNSLRDAYILAIKQKIQRNWLRPKGITEIPDCEIRVIQGPGGFILKVSFGSCPGWDKTYLSSIENAVYKADPLPKPGDPSLFERELIFQFQFNPS